MTWSEVPQLALVAAVTALAAYRLPVWGALVLAPVVGALLVF